MTDLFLHYDGNSLSTVCDVQPNYFCVDLDSFVDSCLAGHNCAMRVCIFQDDYTDYKLALIDARYADEISIDDFYARLVMLNSIYNATEVF